MAQIIKLKEFCSTSSEGPAHVVAYDALKRALRTGAYEPGQKITIMATAEALGMSTTPVREALRRLASEGALELLPNRSVRLPDITLDRLYELTKLRSALEGLAAQEAVRHVSAEDISKLEEIQMAMVAARDRGDVSARLRSNEAFHFTLYEIAQMPKLVKVIDSLWLESGPYFNLLTTAASRHGYAGGLSLHASAINALRQKNGEAARAAIVLDIESAANVLFEQMRDEFGGSGLDE